MAPMFVTDAAVNEAAPLLDGMEVARRRDAVGLSVVGMAHLASVKYYTLRRIERGIQRPTPAESARLRAVLTIMERGAEQARAVVASSSVPAKEAR